MTSDELLEILHRIQDPRFAAAAALLARATSAIDYTVKVSEHLIPGAQLLDAYAVRRDGTRQRGRNPEPLDAIVEMLSAEHDTVWQVMSVAGGPIVGGVLVSSTGHAACFAKENNEKG